jgi:probable phosphoglycerate mutase
VAAYAPDGIFSSDLRRAARTADYLAALVTKPVHLDDRLRERHFGRWEGLTDTEVRERHAADHARYDTTDALLDPTIEPFEDVIKRVTAALQDAAERVGPDGTAIIATHGGAARAGCVGLLGWPPELWRTVGALGNCHVAELTHSQRRGWRLAAHNLA